MSERGHYEDPRRALAARGASGDTGFSFPDLPQDYAPIGVALGIGTLLGILLGTKLTFHLPVRKRR